MVGPLAPLGLVVVVPGLAHEAGDPGDELGVCGRWKRMNVKFVV